MSYTPVLAHLGHWYVSLPIFGVPIVLIAIIVKGSELRERRRVLAGDTSRLRVVFGQDRDRTILSVKGALDYPTLLEVEDKLERAVGRGPRVLLDMSAVSAAEEEFAWGLIDAINGLQAAEITLLIGSAPGLHALGKIAKLEGVKLAGESSVIAGISRDAEQAESGPPVDPAA